MERSIYITDLERLKNRLVERYSRLRRHDNYDSYSERCQWLESGQKNQYPTDVKVNNWVEEQADIDYVLKRRPFLNDFDHSYKTEYIYNFGAKYPSPSDETIRRVAHYYPGHQPELDLPKAKAGYNTYVTTFSAAYQDPSLLQKKASGPKCEICEQTSRSPPFRFSYV